MTDDEVNPNLDVDLLLVVDVQNGFTNERSEHVVAPVASFVRHWLSEGRPVIATRFINTDDSQWERLIHWSRLKTSPEIDLRPEILRAIEANPHARVIDKYTYTSLTEEVQDLLKELGTQRVVICGIDTDSCVLKSAIDLFEAGLTPIVLSDLCASHAGDEVHNAGLMLAGRFIGSDQIRTSFAMTRENSPTAHRM